MPIQGSQKENINERYVLEFGRILDLRDKQ